MDIKITHILLVPSFGRTLTNMDFGAEGGSKCIEP